MIALAPLRVQASGMPACIRPGEFVTTKTVRVDKNGTLQLRGGTMAHLEGIRLPGGARDHAPEPFASQALSAVSELVLERRSRFVTVPPKEDRYGRIRAQVFNGDTWVQEQLLRRGLARVSIAPDRIECATELYQAEASARAAHAGLWSSPAYAIRGLEDIGRYLGTFQIVQGRIAFARVRDGSAWLQFGASAEFAAVILPDDLRVFRAMGVDPRGYAGRIIRIRGIIQNIPQPAIEIANPIQVEIVQ